jgi:Phosphate transport regulator (distant homolog of PhoU)
MAQKHNNNYFDMFLDLHDYSARASVALNKYLTDFSLDTLEESLISLHHIEHSADLASHVVKEKLAKEFITPIEREDILRTVCLIDDITDAIEDVLIKIDMYRVKTILPEALEFCAIIEQCCQGLTTIYKEFHNFKKSKELHAGIVEVNRLEDEGDKLYRKAMRNLFDGSHDPIEVLAWSEVYSQLERCCDLCEDVADYIQEIIMKNA